MGPISAFILTIQHGQWNEGIKLPVSHTAASVGQRIIAAFIDTAIFLLFAFTMWSLNGIWTDKLIPAVRPPRPDMTTWPTIETLLHMGLWIPGLLVFIIPTWVHLARKHASFGKRIMGLKIVDIRGQRPNSTAVIYHRWIIRKICAVAFLPFAVVDWIYLLSPHGRSMGDRIAGTFVVRVPRAHSA